ncbi:MAG TPA: hypothetical protein VJX67_11315 [Blastocatellia bacterium]|nr:hypothetical protein [Blastocatellia bacterium]
MSEEPENKSKTVHTDLEHLAQEQGVKPLDWDLILSGHPLGPEDETADMMIAQIYRWRRDARDRNLP